ncbi:MAG: hypothetical protein DRP45_06400 [Candidatus Zixiibacteriota bacterium]|nr:MAG: hypothetical protein DRP45_06400 [candidate division Zixibacteria bacterium]
MIVVKSPAKFNINKSLEELLAHEYAHLALAHRVGHRHRPRWFDEGLAVLVSREWSWASNLTMSLSAVVGQFVPLEEIEMVNRFGAGKARLAYAESYLAVQYFFDEYGIKAVNLFVDSIAAGASIDNSLMASTGSNYADFETEFRVYLQSRFNLVTLITDMTYFWIALAVILIIGFFLKMRKKREYLRKWDEEEKMASTDFDYGDSDHPEQTDDDEPWRR